MSGFMDRTAGAVEYCEAMTQALSSAGSNKDASFLAEHYYQPITEFCQQKLWHQLTLRALEFVQDPRCGSPVAVEASTACSGNSGASSGGAASRSSPYLALYDKVILAVDSKLHPLSLARIATAVAQTLVLGDQDLTAAKAVLENLLVQIQDQIKAAEAAAAQETISTLRSSPSSSLQMAAVVFIQSSLNLLLLSSTTSQTDTAPILETIRKNSSRLQTEWSDWPAIVHAAHYEQALQYYKTVGPPEAFFEQAMSFLHYAPPPDASTSEMTTTISRTNYHQLAVDLCLAALTGEGVYNLSQVVQEQGALLQLLEQPTSASAQNFSWLVQLLKATAAGHVAEFQQLTQEHAAAIAKQPALVHRAAAVQEKLTLLALVDLVFHKPSHERNLSFTEIAQHLQIQLDQVEWVVMRALSVKLIEGSLDQCDQTVHISWVVPRVLSPEQLQQLAKRYGGWADRVRSAKELVQEHTAF